MNELEIRHTVAQRIIMSTKALSDMEKAIAAYKAAYKEMMEAEKALLAASDVGKMDSEVYELIATWRYQLHSPVPSPEAISRAQNVDLWRGTVEKCMLWQLMDNTAREEFKKSLKRNPVEFTEENALATLLNLVPQVDDFFRRGLVNTFCSLSSQYRSNDQFKIGKKIVLEKIYDTVFWCIHEYSASKLDDLERAFYTLDGARFGEEEPLSRTLQRYARGKGIRNEKSSHTMDTKYFTAKVFKNGNVHLQVKDKNLLDACNREIAKHFGESLPDGN